MNIKDRIKNDFTYHTPPAEVRDHFVKLREKALELADLITDLVPNGREQSSALTRLEEAIFHANAGIARQYPAEKKSEPLRIFIDEIRPTHLNYAISYYVEGTQEKVDIDIPSVLLRLVMIESTTMFLIF